MNRRVALASLLALLTRHADAAPALVEAALRGDTAALRRLLAAGAAVNQRDERGRTAALAATQDERLKESAILRTLGASRRQILAVMLSEYALIGALSGMVAVLGAMGLGWFVSVRLLELPYNPSLWLPLLGIGSGILLVLMVGWRSINQVLRVPPLQTLNEIG